MNDKDTLMAHLLGAIGQSYGRDGLHFRPLLFNPKLGAEWIDREINELLERAQAELDRINSTPTEEDLDKLWNTNEE